MASKRREPQFLRASPTETGAAVPLPYEVWSDGVYKLDETKTPDTAELVEPDIDERPPASHRKYLERIALKPVWVAGTGITDGTMPEAVVQLAWLLDDVVQARWFGMADISDTKRLVDLSKFGVPSSSENARELVAYLTRAARLVSITCAGSVLISRCGWRDTKEGKGFLLGDTWYGSGRVVSDPRGANVKYAKALRPAGDADVWLDWVRKVYEESWAARFTLSASCGALLLHLLDERSWFLYHWGGSTRGKSALAQFCTSIYGKPEILTGSFNRTLNSVTGIFRQINDMPVTFDELQVAGDLDTSQVIYSVCTERSKERAGRDGSLLNDQEAWKTVLFMTGEKPVVEKDLGGQANRGFQFNVPIFDKLGDGAVLYAAAHEHYGHGARVLVPYLVQKVNGDPGYISKLRETFKILSERLEREAKVPINHAKIAATAVLGGWLLTEVLLGRGKDERSQLFDDAVTALNEGTPGAGSSLADRALDALREHRVSSGGAWIDGRITPYEAKQRMANARNIMGIVTTYRGVEEVWFMPAQVDRYLRSLDLLPVRVWNDLATTQRLTRGEDKHFAPRRPFGEHRTRVYVIPYAVLFPIVGKDRLVLVQGGVDGVNPPVPVKLDALDDDPDVS